MPRVLAIQLALGAGAFALAGCAIRPDIAPTLHTTAGDMTAACVGSGLAAFHVDLGHAAGARAPDDAWQLAEALACERGDAAHRVIASHIHGPIERRTEAADLTDVSEADPNAEGLRDGYLKGGAWGARVEQADGDLSVQFSTNEYCWAGATLRFDGRGWGLVEVNGGCD